MNTCEICQKTFVKKYNLKVHIKRIHTGEKPFFCDFCEKSFRTLNDWKRHKLTHTGEKPYSCNICRKKFNQQVNLKAHKLTHFSIEPFKCMFCKEEFSFLNDLKVHERFHIKVDQFKCNKCGKSFKSNNELTDHGRIHTEDKPFKCDFCEKCFSQLGHLTAHKMFHAAEKQYLCELCQKSFCSSSDLSVHNKTTEHLNKIESMQNKVQPSLSSIYVKQEVIKKETENIEDGVKQEIKDDDFLPVDFLTVKMHTNEKPFKCDFCEKCFSQLGHLTAHKLFHAAEKQYLCELCQKSFCSSSDLSVHNKTNEHFNKIESMQNKVQPSLSSIYVKQEVIKKETENIEDVIKQEIKDDDFLPVDFLTIKMITDEKPFKCDFCEKGFSQLGHLTAHKMFHAAEKQYLCNLCQKSFCSSSDLSVHNKTNEHLNKIEYMQNKVQPSFSSSLIKQEVNAESIEGVIKQEIKTDDFLPVDFVAVKMEAANE